MAFLYISCVLNSTKTTNSCVVYFLLSHMTPLSISNELPLNNSVCDIFE